MPSPLLTRKQFFLAVLYLVALCVVHARARVPHHLDTPMYDHTNLSKRKITQHDRTFYKFVTRPDIDVHSKQAVEPGYWFVSPYGQLGQDRPGQKWVDPHIYDGNGELVWSGTSMFRYWNVFDFESRIVHGERMRTLLSAHEEHGFILNSSYEVYKKIPLVQERGTKMNVHEFNVFDEGRRALFLKHIDANASVEESREIGFNGRCLARYQGFSEVEIGSNGTPKVIFDWDARRHIAPNESTYRKYDGSIDQQCIRDWDILSVSESSLASLQPLIF